MEQALKTWGDDLSLITENVRMSLFNTTPKISTYLYAICSGKYDYYESNNEDGLPMRIYLRESLKADLDPSEMFLVTKAGMKTYKEYFGIAYPFSKYDQIFTPEHNFGAMENVGLVTYNEMYIMRGEVKTLAKRLKF